MVIINFYKSDSMDYMLSLTIFKILAFEMFDPENLGQDHRVQYSQWFL